MNSFEQLELDYGPLDGAETTLLHQLTLLGRIQSGREFLDPSEYDEAIEGMYQKIWNGLDRLRPDLIKRFIEVEGITQ